MKIVYIVLPETIAQIIQVTMMLLIFILVVTNFILQKKQRKEAEARVKEVIDSFMKLPIQELGDIKSKVRNQSHEL